MPTTHRSAFFEVLCSSGTGSNAVTTELPAATTLLQSRSANDDSEKRLKFFLNSCMDSTVAGAPSGLRFFAFNGIIYFPLRDSSPSGLLA